MVNPNPIESLEEREYTPLILATKLQIPPPRPGLVARPHLVNRLEAGLARKLTVISAPAGFGKTTLLGEWAKESQHPIAWVSLDANDNDPVRFWTYVIAALQKLDDRLGLNAQTLLRPQSSGVPSLEDALTSLINEMGATALEGQPIILVLDDYHLIKNAAIHDSLTFLLDNQPSQLHLVLATRADPKLSVAHLRAKQQLAELRAADLRFTPAEIATFLNQVVGLSLSPEQIAALDARTEGWIAGLQLAALSMQNRSDLAGFIAAFTGTNRYILDFLVEQVLQQQPAEIQAFLLQTSILERLCAPLCDTLLNGSATSANPDSANPGDTLERAAHDPSARSQQILEDLERANLFVVALDDERQWYRYHHLFAEFLRHHLRHSQPAAIPLLYRRAAQWCAENGLSAEAIHYAVESKDYALAADLIERHCIDTLRRGEVVTLHSWLSALPRELVRTRARLALGLAWTLLWRGQLDEAETCLRDAEQAAPDGREDGRYVIAGEATAIRAFIASFRGDAARTIALCHQALDRIPESEVQVRSMVAWSLGSACWHSGDLNGVEQAMTLAIRLSQQRTDGLDMLHYATPCLAAVESIHGQLHRAATLYRRALQSAGESGEEHALSLCQPLIGMGDLLREWNDLPAAREHLDEGMALCQRAGTAIVQINGYAVLARLQQAEGNLEAALETVTRAEEIARQSQSSRFLAQATAERVRMQLIGGQVDPVAEWLATRGNTLRAEWNSIKTNATALEPIFEFECETLARVLVGLGREPAFSHLMDDARRLLDELLEKAEAEDRLGRVIEVRILQALALDGLGDRSGASNTLELALRAAASQGYVRLFVDEGEPMRALLLKCRQQIEKRYQRTHEQELAALLFYADRLLTAFPSSGMTQRRPAAADYLQAGTIEPLSDREREILALITQGYSNQDIAGQLYLTVGTVKWHVNHILGKLNARNRHQAATRARELGLVTYPFSQ